MQTGMPEKSQEGGLSSEKREDIWALLIALGVLVICFVIPEQVYAFFKSTLYLF